MTGNPEQEISNVSVKVTVEILPFGSINIRESYSFEPIETPDEEEDNIKVFIPPTTCAI